MHVRPIEGEERVTPLELFFDLVFVFAITQVTGFLGGEHETGEGLLRGLLLLAALWWAWAAYAWLTNTLNPEEGAVRLAVFTSAACDARSLPSRRRRPSEPMPSSSPSRTSSSAPWVVLYAIASARRSRAPGCRAVGSRRAPCCGPTLLVAAGFFDGPVEIGLWIAALSIDYLSALAGTRAGVGGSRPAHFVERHGLIIIIALGESIVAIGVGAAGGPRWPHDHGRHPGNGRRRGASGGRTSTGSSSWRRHN